MTIDKQIEQLTKRIQITEVQQMILRMKEGVQYVYMRQRTNPVHSSNYLKALDDVYTELNKLKDNV